MLLVSGFWSTALFGAAASMPAYALVLNDQSNWAKTLIDNYEKNQISDLAILGFYYDEM